MGGTILCKTVKEIDLCVAMNATWSAVAQQCNAGLAIERARVRISLCYRFEDWAFSFSPMMPPCSLSCINEYLSINSGGNVSDLGLLVSRNCCITRMIAGRSNFFLRLFRVAAVFNRMIWRVWVRVRVLGSA